MEQPKPTTTQRALGFLNYNGIWNTLEDAQPHKQTVLNTPSYWMENEYTRLCIILLLMIMFSTNVIILNQVYTNQDDNFENVSETVYTAITVMLFIIVIIVLALTKINLYVNFPRIYLFRFTLFIVILFWTCLPIFGLLYTRPEYGAGNAKNTLITNAWISVFISGIGILWIIVSWVMLPIVKFTNKTYRNIVASEDKCKQLKGAWDDYGTISLKYTNDDPYAEPIIDMCDKYTGELYRYNSKSKVFEASLV